MLAKAITPKNAAAESNVNSVEDPKMVHSAAPDPQRVLLESQEVGLKFHNRISVPILSKSQLLPSLIWLSG